VNKELDLWQFAGDKLKKNESLILLIVAESSGSSPGRQGFKMIVSKDEMRGSIGGGVMEMRLVELAKFKIQNSKFKIQAEIIEQIHRKNAPNASGMICSGRQKVILFKLNPSDYNLIRKIAAYVKNSRDRYLRITHESISLTAKKIPPFEFKFEQISESEFFYEERLGFKQKLYIIGGGHCALALSELMSKMDFHIALFDDRADLNTLEKNEFAHEKLVIESYEEIGDFIPSGANVYVVVMTLGYKFDEIVIRKLFDKNFKYFGVLGSKAKMKTLLKTLEKEGFDKEKLAQIHTPIGLPINSRTPEEIAVSIAAEIIAVKNSA